MKKYAVSGIQYCNFSPCLKPYFIYSTTCSLKKPAPELPQDCKAEQRRSFLGPCNQRYWFGIGINRLCRICHIRWFDMRNLEHRKWTIGQTKMMWSFSIGVTGNLILLKLNWLEISNETCQAILRSVFLSLAALLCSVCFVLCSVNSTLADVTHLCPNFLFGFSVFNLKQSYCRGKWVIFVGLARLSADDTFRRANELCGQQPQMLMV